jgi:hypothetical protein
MTLSLQSHFPGFFLSPESHFIGFCKSSKMASAIPACNKPELAGPGKSASGIIKSRKMTCQGPADSDLRQARIGQAPVSHLRASQITKDDLPGPGKFQLDKPELRLTLELPRLLLEL